MHSVSTIRCLIVLMHVLVAVQNSNDSVMHLWFRNALCACYLFRI